MIQFIRLPRWQAVLIAIYGSRERDRYAERLYRRLNTSRSHVREIVKKLAIQSLIEISSARKTKLLTLTKKGERMAVSLMNLNAELN